MADPDIFLGPGDTDQTEIILDNPDAADGSSGGPFDLTGAQSVVVKHHPRDGSAATTTRAAIVLQSGTTNEGAIAIDWLIGGAPPPGDHRLRVVVVDAAGRQRTWPRGPDLDLPDGTNASWWWLQVARDAPA